MHFSISFQFTGVHRLIYSPMSFNAITDNKLIPSDLKDDRLSLKRTLPLDRISLLMNVVQVSGTKIYLFRESKNLKNTASRSYLLLALKGPKKHQTKIHWILLYSEHVYFWLLAFIMSNDSMKGLFIIIIPLVFLPFEFIYY